MKFLNQMKVNDLITMLQDYVAVHGNDELVFEAMGEDVELIFHEIHDAYAPDKERCCEVRFE